MKKKQYLYFTLLLASSLTLDTTPKEYIFRKTNLPISKDIRNSLKEEELENIIDQHTIGSGAGQLTANPEDLSDVITFGGMVKKPATSKLLTNSGIEISFTGKERMEGATGVNTKYLNNANLAVDSYLIPGKSTTDIGFQASAGKHAGYDYDVINLGIDLRSRVTWGKPQEVGKTTTSTLSYNDINYGTHSHTIGIPILYLRGADLTLNLNGLFCNLNEEYPHQKFKLGLFPFEIGRGISLGAAYLVSPDVLSYAPVDVIQEFAPGFMLYGDINKAKNIHYRLYLGIIKNLSGSTSDLLEKTRTNHYGMETFPYRGTGVFNVVSALQIDWKCINDDYRKMIISPYIVGAHEGAGKVILPEDSVNNVLTYGLELSAEQKDDWDLSFEFAKNNGSQYVYGIDTNALIMEQRTCTVDGSLGSNPNTSIGVITNSAVKFNGYNNIPGNENASLTTDVYKSNATYLGMTSKRQKAINKVYKSSFSNGTIIELPEEGYSLQNSATRFRDPYQNLFGGFMMVCDIGKTLHAGDQSYKLALAFGYASGDRNPNKDLIGKNDHIRNLDYNGFIGVQEIYSGKMVRSAFLMRGAGSMPRINTIPNAVLDEDGNIIETVAYPSPMSGFNNLIYCGSSINLVYEGKAYNWKWFPNILLYAQPSAREIYHPKVIEKLGKEELSPFLGTELNLFLEIISKNIAGFKIFLVGSVFVPGSYYKDLRHVPLDKNQESFIYGTSASQFVPLYNNNNSYYLNIGLEFAF